MAGLADLQLRGAADAARCALRGGALHEPRRCAVHDVTIVDPQGTLRASTGLEGDVRLNSGVDAPAIARLRWQGGALYGLAFGAAQLPFVSSDGELRLREAVAVPMLGGSCASTICSCARRRAGRGWTCASA